MSQLPYLLPLTGTYAFGGPSGGQAGFGGAPQGGFDFSSMQ